MWLCYPLNLPSIVSYYMGLQTLEMCKPSVNDKNKTSKGSKFWEMIRHSQVGYGNRPRHMSVGRACCNGSYHLGYNSPGYSGVGGNTYSLGHSYRYNLDVHLVLVLLRLTCKAIIHVLGAYPPKVDEPWTSGGEELERAQPISSTLPSGSSHTHGHVHTPAHCECQCS